jgi:pimeloyl-ACP methyl ester carboxylesterase
MCHRASDTRSRNAAIAPTRDTDHSANDVARSDRRIVASSEGSMNELHAVRDRKNMLVAACAAAAATAGWVAGRAQRAEEQHPPAGRFIEIDGVRVHYFERGEGTPVVLLHGNVVMLQDFVESGLVDALAERHRVIAFDRPGFGYTTRPRLRLWTPDAQAELLVRVFEALGVEAPVVVGHSWATLVAIALGLRSAARRLVLLSGYYFPTARFDAVLVAPVATPVIGDVLRYTVSALLARIMLHRALREMFAPERLPADYEAVVDRELMLRPSQIRADAEEGVFLVPAAMHFQDRYAHLDVPTEIIAGASDRIVDPAAHSSRLHDVVRGSRLRIVAAAGHMLHHTHAAEVIAAVEDDHAPAPEHRATQMDPAISS